MAPLAFTGSPAAAMQWLWTIIAALPRTRIVAADERYLHAEFASPLFRFVDDVEFLIDPDQQVIHFRSASRAGYWGFGVNRRRMRRIQREFERPC